MVLTRRSLLRPFSWALLPGACWAWALPARGQSDGLCDPGLPQRRDDPYGYRVRGDRCEGLFAREVGAGAPRIVGFGRHVEDFDAMAGGALRLRWPRPPLDGPVRLRVHCLRPRVYYRMDTQAPGGRNEFSWSPGLLASLGLRRGDLAVIGWVTQGAADGPRRVLLPVDLLQRAAAPADRPLRMWAICDAEVTQWVLRWWPDGDSGRAVEIAGAAGYHPPGSAFEFTLPATRGTPVVRVELLASLRDGGVSSSEGWVHVP